MRLLAVIKKVRQRAAQGDTQTVAERRHVESGFTRDARKQSRRQDVVEDARQVVNRPTANIRGMTVSETTANLERCRAGRFRLLDQIAPMPPYPVIEVCTTREP